LKQIKKLAFVVNKTKSGAVQLAESLKYEAITQGVEIKMTDDYPLPDGFLDGQDACCVLGGDGTLLGIVKESIKSDVPVFGVNQGKLGFLATYTQSEIRNELSRIIQGDYKIDYRVLLELITENGRHFNALNDIVIKGHKTSAIITLKVYCNNEFVTPYRCDGLIFATPTGSTAYNLSANGPIIDPGAEVIVMTPICPHTLSNRSVIFSHDETLQVDPIEPMDPVIVIDGREVTKFYGAPVKIKIATQFLQLLQPINYSHFHILRNKLNWAK
jgi:NAD+ kinase